MTSHEAARPAGREADATRPAEDDVSEAVTPGKVPPLEPAPLLDPWLAFVSAGVAASAAGYVATTAATFSEVFRSMGIESPGVTALVLNNPSLVPLALVGAAAVLLALGGVRRATSRPLDVLAGTRLLAVLVAAAGFGCIAANVLVFHELQKSLSR